MDPIVVFHIPHSSTVIPPAERECLSLSDAELEKEVLRMTDWYTDALFRLKDPRCVSVHAPVSRLVLDPGWSPDNYPQVPVALRARTNERKNRHDSPADEARQALFSKYALTHHLRLTAAVASNLAQQGHSLVVDCHSFPSRPLPDESDQNPDRPDICLGTDDFHTPAWLSEAAESFFSDAGFRVSVNRPFSGALVPKAYWKRDKRVSSIMIELNRHLYMDESNGCKLPDFTGVSSRFEKILKKIVDLYDRESGTG